MTKAPKPTGYSDEDLAQINQRLDEADEKRDEAIKKARDDHKRALKVITAEAKAVNVLMGPLKIARKVRKLEEQIEETAGKVKEDEIEVFTDMLGQMSFLAPDDGETAGVAAARKRAADIAETTAREQVEGAKALEELVH